MSTSDLSRWTWEEDKQFEDCILDSVGRWEEIAACLGTKSAAEVEHHYALLLKDMEAMEAGEIEPPAYLKCSKSVKRKMSKAKPWTEDEHRLFLEGLKKYGKGDWKSISRFAVGTRNPSQVASHAQKHFKRQEENERKKRRSIFDSSN
ncbi:transcription factor SRM1-like [Salvia hispanica]|uniref:transcription factor SRM1-like n=1 Tax=Salvia hispanica TaxID=49212 RepID=UPI0020090F2C|nr:transcription factor SRM1-like [Salvia hispanica]